MARTKGDPALRKVMCSRLVRLLSIARDENWGQLSSQFQYASRAGMQAIKDGRAFPDVQRLRQLMEWRIEGHFQPSLHWILTGTGPALFRIEGDMIIEGLSLEDLAARRAATRRVR